MTLTPFEVAVAISVTLAALLAVVTYVDWRLNCPCDVASPCARCPLTNNCQEVSNARD